MCLEKNLLLILTNSYAEVIQTNWTDKFRKTLTVSCSANEIFCENLCGSSSFCQIEEGPCRDCIGTGLKINFIFSEIGQSILNSGKQVDLRALEELINSGEFVSLTAQDVYNIVDGVQSVETYKKFESLCPQDSVNQIIFLRVNPSTREIDRPEMVYCDLGNLSQTFLLTSRPTVVVRTPLLELIL